MTPKEIFLAACNKISGEFAELGFKPGKNGKSLKKTTADKDITFELFFQSSSLNNPGSVTMLPHFLISSKRLKKWCLEQNNGEYVHDVIYGEQLGYVTHFQEWKSWNVSGSMREKTINEVIKTIKTYVLPIFDLFEDKETAIKFLVRNGTKFNRYTSKSLIPLAFVLCNGTKEESQEFFLNYLADAEGKGLIINLYKQLAEGKPVDFKQYEFFESPSVKLAFLNGLKISK